MALVATRLSTSRAECGESATYFIVSLLVKISPMLFSRPMALVHNRPIGSPLVVRDTISQDFGHTESRSNAVYAAATYGLLLSHLAQFVLLIQCAFREGSYAGAKASSSRR